MLRNIIRIAREILKKIEIQRFFLFKIRILKSFVVCFLFNCFLFVLFCFVLRVLWPRFWPVLNLGRWKGGRERRQAGRVTGRQWLISCRDGWVADSDSQEERRTAALKIPDCILWIEGGQTRRPIAQPVSQ